MTAQSATVPAASPARRTADASRRYGLFLVLAVLLVVAYAVMGPAQWANAWTLGAIYALVALGYTMVYGIIELINFAHGDVFMVGSFVSMWFLDVPSWASRAPSTTSRA